tara:strand:- start:3210 stop:3698 length:489 start_codon:yes stop_codon:yes gene_type:complete
MSVSSIRPEDLPSCTSSGSELGGASGEAGASAAKPEVVDTLREKIFATFDDPSYSKAAKFISIFMMLIILVSTLSFLFEAETLEGGFLRSNKDDAEVRAVSGPALLSCVAPAARAALLLTRRRRPAEPVRATCACPACAVVLPPNQPTRSPPRRCAGRLLLD